MEISQKRFSHNIRAYRKRLNMTQKQLADATGYSEKTVSKWECGPSIPPVDALFRIAEIFSCDINDLFRDDTQIYYLGIDGGGTKTAFALANQEGRIIRSLRLDPCNPFDIGIDRAREVLSTGIREICRGIPLSSVAVYAGIAGGISGSMQQTISAFLSEFHFAAHGNGSDNENLIMAGLDSSDGITMILGTGICAFAVKGEERRCIAGWGYLFDDGGSAYNIGRDALHHYFAVIDGTDSPSLLSKKLASMHEGTPNDFIGELYSGGKKHIASFAPIVFEAADGGDKTAKSILRRNMWEVAKLLTSAAKTFPEKQPLPVVLAGGLTAQPRLVPMIRELLPNSSRFDIKILASEPVEGAVKLAMNLYSETHA